MAPAGLKAWCGQMRETLYVHQRGVVFYPVHGFFQRGAGHVRVGDFHRFRRAGIPNYRGPKAIAATRLPMPSRFTRRPSAVRALVPVTKRSQRSARRRFSIFSSFERFSPEVTMTGIALCAFRDGIMPVCSAVAEPPHDMRVFRVPRSKGKCPARDSCRAL